MATEERILSFESILIAALFRTTESRETTANHVPDVPQKIRARFKAQNPGSGMPPFIRVETDNTSPEYRLEAIEARRRSSENVGEEALVRSGSIGDGGPLDSKPEASSTDFRPPPPPGRRSFDGRGRGGRRGSGGRFGGRGPRGSPRGSYRSDSFSFRRASSSSFDSPRDISYGGRSSASFEVPREESLEASGGDIDQTVQESSSSLPEEGPPAAGQKRGYSDAFAPNQGSSRGYAVDSDEPPASSRQRQE